ncbi:GntR family transcriptional regulator [Pseudoponticoccus marisrubri]|uniref:GntR family transcriptional regulator n=1 Tax=Pseudoponticoccus marisrubri TaxID=1685382 RepID=A0A0W7WPF1_9RHOB|nr:GntR family transcriptional regulator [Pseudoponticoccus marisrubri]KUF12478.1 GntR family transcriptional regulator [Pseudoponticoccus marisrubri]
MKDRHALPLYLQISEMLIREIHAGRLADGARLPPERDYAASLNISVGTLRKALADLAEKGLLERVHGSGNYIRARADVESVYAFFRVELLQGGGLPTAELLSVDRLPKPEGMEPFGTSSEAHRIRRLRRLNGTPAILEEIWLDGSYAARLAPQDLRESLYLFYRERLNLWISGAEDRLGTGPVPDWAPPAFGPEPGRITLLASRVSHASDGARAEISRGWIDTDVATYVARLK